ncbi:hypothetical protein Hdeb2414_s0003g00092821 [Helianthus debilis subsp. tardiflorus]
MQCEEYCKWGKKMLDKNNRSSKTKTLDILGNSLDSLLLLTMENLLKNYNRPYHYL